MALHPYAATRGPRQRPTRQGLAYWIERDGAVLLTRRPETGLLGGMMEVPGSDWIDAGEPALQPAVTGTEKDGLVEHTFTHFHLQVRVVVPEADPDAAAHGEAALKRLGALPRLGGQLTIRGHAAIEQHKPKEPASQRDGVRPKRHA